MLLCDNGTDDDGDGVIDFLNNGMGDPGCTSPTGTSELSNSACNNGLDDDGDGRTDYRVDMSGDLGCTDGLDASELGTTACDNGTDDDGDGRADYDVMASQSDPGCTGPTDTDERGTLACDDGMDNDNDGRSDYHVTALLLRVHSWFPGASFRLSADAAATRSTPQTRASIHLPVRPVRRRSARGDGRKPVLSRRVDE